MMKLYVYDHCPYCVKARMIFGFKDVPLELVTLLNDDEFTPTRLIGQKLVPILTCEDGTHMPESLDIVEYIDTNYGDEPLLVGQERAEIADWLAGVREYSHALTMPRWVKAPLEEFATQGARDYFTAKKEAYIGPFAEQLENSDALIAQAETHLAQLDGLIQSPDSISSIAGVLSLDDIHVFTALRGLTIVKGLDFPTHVQAYVQRMAHRTGIPLYTNFAI